MIVDCRFSTSMAVLFWTCSASFSQGPPLSRTACAAGRASASVAARAAIFAASSVEGRALQIRATIPDAGMGNVWILQTDPRHPGGPGLLIPGASSRKSKPRTNAWAAANVAVPMRIHAGAPVVIEEHTDALDVRLNAVALAPAAMGECFAARLNPGGTIVRAIASAPGRARLAPLRAGRP